MSKNFRDLSEAEILALAISLEEEDGRIYGDFADGLRDGYPATAATFDEMHFRVATTLATVVVAPELAVISDIRHCYMDTPIVSAAMPVALGGTLVFLTDC